MDTLPEVPDWQAINAAHRVVEAMRPLEDTARAVGALPLSVVFELAEKDQPTLVIPSLIEVPPVARKTNGFGGRSKTYRAAPDRSIDVDPCKGSFNEQLSRLDTLQSEVGEEIDDPKRWFFKWVETTHFNGEVFRMREYIYDKDIIAGIKEHERAARDVVVNALRVDIFEKHHRTRGFPSAQRLEAEEELYRNVAHLRSDSSGYADDPLVQAMLADLEERLQQEPLDESKSRYRNQPKWLRSVQGDHF